MCPIRSDSNWVGPKSNTSRMNERRPDLIQNYFSKPQQKEVKKVLYIDKVREIMEGQTRKKAADRILLDCLIRDFDLVKKYDFDMRDQKEVIITNAWNFFMENFYELAQKHGKNDEALKRAVAILYV